MCLNHNKGGLFPDSRWSQPLPLPSACLTRNSFRPGAVSSLRAFPGFLRRSFPPLPARLLLTSEQGRYAKRLIPADFALFPTQLFHWLFSLVPDKSKFLATHSWVCSRNHAVYRLINTHVMVLNEILTEFLFWRDCLILRGWYRTERSEAVLVGFVKIAGIRFPSYCFHCRAMHCTANGFIKLALIALILI